MSKILTLLGQPREWPPLFPDDVRKIQFLIQNERGVSLTGQEAASFWEEYSDPDGWISFPDNPEEVVNAYDRLYQTRLRVQ